ncbi:MAG: type II toxin-antitoxin system Phd/YefM family antitoxin [Spirochaetia bacterium]|nr:type II toxin-antitoxin system Phd/YefM family antitoxin [Spirochaetia bacterium]
MKTISVSKLKAHLSAELKEVKKGSRIIVLDHRHPVAILGDSSIKHVLACEHIISSELLEIESRRVIHRYRIDGGIDDEGFVQANTRLNEVLSGISLLALSSAVKRRAMGAFPVHVKTLDAVHMLSVLPLLSVSIESNVGGIGKSHMQTQPKTSTNKQYRRVGMIDL